MPNPSVSFNITNPYQAQLDEISRRQKLAELMQAQSIQPTERFSYKGIEAPVSPLSGLAKMLQMYTSMKQQEDLAGERKEIAEQYRNQAANEGRQFIGALRGTPEIPMPSEELGGGPGRPAAGPDMARALEMSMGSINPMVQGAGGALLTSMMPKATKWEKVELPTPEGGKKVGWVDINSANPESTFRLGGEQGAKTELINVGGSMVPRTGFEKDQAPIQRTESPDSKATREQAERHWNGLSANQQAALRNEAARLGISQQDLQLRVWQVNHPALSYHEGETGPLAFNPRAGTATPVMTPAGTPVPGGKPLTETQGKATLFATRANQANQVIEGVGAGGTVQPGGIKRVGESIPVIGGGVGTALNVTQSAQQQQVEQSQRDFINAVLRQESGATITPVEFDNATKQYFPQPGDSIEVIAQKSRNRQSAIAGLTVQAGAGMQRIAPLIPQAQGQSATGVIKRYNPATGRIE